MPKHIMWILSYTWDLSRVYNIYQSDGTSWTTEGIFFSLGRHGEAGTDVDWAFRMLQARFAIVRGLGHVWDRDALTGIGSVCYNHITWAGSGFEQV